VGAHVEDEREPGVPARTARPVPAERVKWAGREVQPKFLAQLSAAGVGRGLVPLDQAAWQVPLVLTD
jgi:hypothetical protein